MANQQIVAKLQRVTCRDETGGVIAEKVGNDEIWLSGVAFDAAGAIQKVDPFEIYSNFDDGETKTFSPPRTLFTLPVPDGDTFPKSCGVTFLLCERADGSGHQDATNKLEAEMPAIVAKAKADAAGVGGVVTANIWGEVLKYLLTYLGGWIAGQVWSGIKDNVFEPQIATVDVASNDFRWGDGTKLSPENTLIFTGHKGKYYVTFYWEIQSVNQFIIMNPATPALGGTLDADPGAAPGRPPIA